MIWTIEVPATDRLAVNDTVLADKLAKAVTALRQRGGGRTRLWIGHVAEGDNEMAACWGFSPYRDLWQLRCPLPAPASDLAVRSFEAKDAAAVLKLNQRAFCWHPEQGAMTADDLRARQAEPWYEPAGFLLHEREGRLAGFCWTKLHFAGTAPPADVALGEIYVVAVDPDFQGRGIGAPLTLAGLGYLHNRGAAVGMLYVESDNRAANAVYDRLGFRRHHTNRAYLANL